MVSRTSRSCVPTGEQVVGHFRRLYMLENSVLSNSFFDFFGPIPKAAGRGYDDRRYIHAFKQSQLNKRKKIINKDTADFLIPNGEIWCCFQVTSKNPKFSLYLCALTKTDEY